MSTKVVTGEVRLGYVHLIEPQEPDEPGQDAKYSVQIMIPKSDKITMDKIWAAEKEAAEAGKSSKFGGKIPQNLASIIKDGDETAEDYPEREGFWLLNVRSKQRPGLVDSSLNPIMDATEVYSGMWARVSLAAFPYNFGVKKGVSFALNNVMKTRDDDPLGGAPSKPEDDFAEFANDDII